jgi:hypothetical protein
MCVRIRNKGGWLQGSLLVVHCLQQPGRRSLYKTLYYLRQRTIALVGHVATGGKAAKHLGFDQ